MLQLTVPTGSRPPALQQRWGADQQQAAGEAEAKGPLIRESVR